MISVVIKPFTGTDQSGALREFAPGDLVDSTDWRNEVAMASQGVRKIRPATGDEIKRFDAGATNIRETKKPARAKAPA